jgi:hypothetical protein
MIAALALLALPAAGNPAPVGGCALVIGGENTVAEADSPFVADPQPLPDDDRTVTLVLECKYRTPSTTSDGSATMITVEDTFLFELTGDDIATVRALVNGLPAPVEDEYVVK